MLEYGGKRVEPSCIAELSGRPPLRLLRGINRGFRELIEERGRRRRGGFGDPREASRLRSAAVIPTLSPKRSSISLLISASGMGRSMKVSPSSGQRAWSGTCQTRGGPRKTVSKRSRCSWTARL